MVGRPVRTIPRTPFITYGLSLDALVASLALRWLLESEEAWLFKVTPAHLQAVQYLSGDKQSSAQQHCVVIGGEALSTELVQQWRKRLPGARLINEYGPTEATVGCSVYEVLDPEGLTGTGVPIGKPIGNTQLYVLDEAGRQLQPVGCAGELYIGGAGVARGYLNRPELTAQRFIEDRFSAEPGARSCR